MSFELAKAINQEIINKKAINNIDGFFVEIIISNVFSLRHDRFKCVRFCHCGVG